MWVVKQHSKPSRREVRATILAISAVAMVAAFAVVGTSSAAEQRIAPAAFAVCAACHTTSTDHQNGMGPNLRGVVGRKAGTAEGFAYSKAMRDSGIVWTPALLEKFIGDPQKMVPNNMMPFEGEKDPRAQKEIIEYLRALKSQ